MFLKGRDWNPVEALGKQDREAAQLRMAQNATQRTRRICVSSLGEGGSREPGPEGISQTHSLLSTAGSCGLEAAPYSSDLSLSYFLLFSTSYLENGCPECWDCMWFKANLRVSAMAQWVKNPMQSLGSPQRHGFDPQPSTAG